CQLFFRLADFCMSALLLHLEDTPSRRGTLIVRQRQAWKKFIRPIVKDGSFRLRYRMNHGDFKNLYAMLRTRIENEENGGLGRNGTVAGEWALAGTLRWLAGGSIYEVMDGPHIARSTAYAKVQLTLKAILDCNRLRVKFPKKKEDIEKAALGFRNRSSQDVIRACVSAADGLCVWRRKPTKKEHPAPERFHSGHKKGMNMQAICNSDFVFTAVSCNTPCSTNEAWVSAHFDEAIAALPDPYYVLGDAAYGPSEKCW
ncbi:unnamed protein product, partial [Laminaria digitata]